MSASYLEKISVRFVADQAEAKAYMLNDCLPSSARRMLHVDKINYTKRAIFYRTAWRVYCKFFPQNLESWAQREYSVSTGKFVGAFHLRQTGLPTN